MSETNPAPDSKRGTVEDILRLAMTVSGYLNELNFEGISYSYNLDKAIESHLLLKSALHFLLDSISAVEKERDAAITSRDRAMRERMACDATRVFVEQERDTALHNFKMICSDISEDMECLPGCNSQDHELLCPVTNTAEAWRQLRAAKDAALAEVERLRQIICHTRKYTEHGDWRCIFCDEFETELFNDSHTPDCIVRQLENERWVE